MGSKEDSLIKYGIGQNRESGKSVRTKKKNLWDSAPAPAVSLAASREIWFLNKHFPRSASSRDYEATGLRVIDND